MAGNACKVAPFWIRAPTRRFPPFPVEKCARRAPSSTAFDERGIVEPAVELDAVR
jgi:hypothetical protein